MVKNEVFVNPTVQQVIFQIRFPNLFSMESLIGQYQLRIMGKFPESKLAVRRSVVFADIGPEASDAPSLGKIDSVPTQKIWQFTSPGGVVALNVTTDSLDLSSTSHKTYESQEVPNEDRFREVIQFAVDALLNITGLQQLTRVGLRYRDKCPVPAMDNEVFGKWYSSGFPLDRFPLDSVTEMFWFAPVLWSSCYERTTVLFFVPLPGRVGRSAAEPGAAWQRAAYSAGAR